MDVTNFHNQLKELYLPPQGEFTLVDIPEVRYAMIDGTGDPKDGDGPSAVKWLYALAHLVKPAIKERMGKNFVEPPIEFLYWGLNPNDVASNDKASWKWRAMLVFIDWITQEMFEEAVAVVAAKRGPAPGSLRLETLHEGRSIQIMYVGDYSGAPSVCEQLYGHYLPENGFEPNGPYHEVYLNDPQRTAPEKRKLVIRQPIK